MALRPVGPYCMCTNEHRGHIPRFRSAPLLRSNLLCAEYQTTNKPHQNEPHNHFHRDLLSERIPFIHSFLSRHVTHVLAFHYRLGACLPLPTAVPLGAGLGTMA